MIAFWVAAALLSAAVAMLMIARAQRAAAVAAPEDPSLGVYRRQLAEIDDLADRGLLPKSERRSARAEAARRLLAAADRPGEEPAGRPITRTLIFALAVAAPLAGFLIYLLVGSPLTPDQPYAQRLKAWTADPSRLDPDQMAAVLRTIVKQHPRDATPLVYLAHAEVDGGDLTSAERDLRKAIALDPNRAELWLLLGETIAAQTPEAGSPPALEAFQHAAALKPGLNEAHYFVGREQIAGGDVQGGLATWRALIANVPQMDPARGDLQAQITAVEKTGALPSSQPAQAQADPQTMIRGMVQRLADQLHAQPNDPQGWGRLIHAYGVLGDQTAQTAAIASARAEFKGRPDAWNAVQAAEQGPQ